MDDKIWKRLPIEIYFMIKKLYLANVEKRFRYLLAYKSAERKSKSSYSCGFNTVRKPINIFYWENFYNTFAIKEIMTKGLGFSKK